MLFVIGSSSELLGLSSSLELWFCVLFICFSTVLVNLVSLMFTGTIISVSLVHVSVVSVDNPSLPCAPVHVFPLFCGRDGVLGCSRPRKCPFCGRDAEGGLAIPSSTPRQGWCGRRGASARGRREGILQRQRATMQYISKHSAPSCIGTHQDTLMR